jgi:hypothetical protein
MYKNVQIMNYIWMMLIPFSHYYSGITHTCTGCDMGMKEEVKPNFRTPPR